MKKYFNIIINFHLLFIFVFILTNSNMIKENIIIALELWEKSLIPTIFPFLLISNLLINYGFVDFISALFGGIVSKIYNVSKEASFAVIMSLFTGFPTGSKYVKDLYENKIIALEEANSLISFTSFANPIFVISFIGETLLNSKKTGITILVTHYITGLLVGILFKNKVSQGKSNQRIENKNKSFINVLTNTIKSSFNILVNMLGIIIFFFIISTILNKYIQQNLISIILNGIIEMTTGITFISAKKLKRKLKVALIGAFLSFNGLSIHFQTKSIIDGTPIKYRNYCIARIIQSLLCFIILYIIIN